MASRYDYLLEDDEEKKRQRQGITSRYDYLLTPSQEAAEEQKRKSALQVVTETATKVGTAVKDFFLGTPPERVPDEQVQEQALRVNEEATQQLQQQKLSIINYYKDVIDPNSNKRLDVFRTDLDNFEQNRRMLEKLSVTDYKPDVRGKTAGEERDLWNTLKTIEDTKTQTDEVLGFVSADRGFFNELVTGVKEFKWNFPASYTNYQEWLPKKKLEAYEKYKAGEELSDTDKAYLNATRAEIFNALTDKGYGTLAADVATGTLAFGAEMYLTKMLGADVTPAATSLNAISNLTAKRIAAKILGNSVQLAVQSQFDVPMIDARTAEFMLPTVDYEEWTSAETKEDILAYLQDGDDVNSAAWKARATSIVEYVSEGVGDYIDDALPFVKKAFLGKYLQNRGIPKGSFRAVREALKGLHINSVIGEVIEEEIGEPFLAYIEERKYQDPFLTPEGRERLLVEILGISVLQGMSTVSDVAIGRIWGNRKSSKTDSKKSKADDTLYVPVEEKPAPSTVAIVREEGIETPTGEEVPEGARTTEQVRQQQQQVEQQGVVTEVAQEPRTGGEFTAVNKLITDGFTDVNFERAASGAVNISAEGVPAMTIQETPNDISLANVPADIESLIREYAKEANKEVITVESADQIARPKAEAPTTARGAKATGVAEVAKPAEPTLKEIIEPFRTGGGAFVGTAVPQAQRVGFARSLGRAAFFEGRSAAPAQSSEMMELIRAIPDSEGRQEAMRAYSDAWTKANLEQPLEGKYKEGTNFTNEAGEAVRVLGTDNLGRYRVQVTDAQGNTREELLTEEQLDSMTRRRGKGRPKKLPEDLVERTNAVKKGEPASKRISSKIKKKERYSVKTKGLQQEATRNISNAEALAIVRGYFDIEEVDVTFAENITTDDGLEAFGKYSNAMITFANNPDATTPEHEVVHAFLDLFVTPEEKAKIIQQIKSKYGYKSDIEAEERIANDFIEYSRNRKKRPFLKRLYDKVIRFLSNFGGEPDRATKLYDDILNKKRDNYNRDQKLRETYYKKIRKKYEYTTKTLSAMTNDFESGQLGETVSRQTLEAYMRRKGVTKNDTELFERTLNEYKQEPINTLEFMDSLRAKIMPLELIKSGRYANYSNQHLVSYRSGEGRQLNFDNSETHLWNSPFRYDKNGHFTSEFTGEKKGTLITKPFTNPETGFKYVAVVRQGVQLTEDNIDENILHLAENEEDAQDWIKTVETLSESVTSIGYGLFGHTRIGEVLYSPEVREIRKRQETLETVKGDNLMQEFYPKLHKFAVENMKSRDTKFLKNITKWGESYLKKQPRYRYGKYTTLPEMFKNRWEAENPNKDFSKLSLTSKLNYYLAKVKEITGEEVPSQQAERMNMYGGFTTMRFLKSIQFVGKYDEKKDGYRDFKFDYVTTIDDLDDYSYDNEIRWVEAPEAKMRGNAKRIAELEKEIKTLQEKEVEKFIPEYYILENQSDPHQTTYPARTQWNLARLQLKKARKYLRYLESSVPLNTKIKELSKAWINGTKWGKKTMTELVPLETRERTRVEELDSLVHQKIIEGAIKEINDDIVLHERLVTDAEKTLTPLEKQFFAAGSKFYERQIQEEIRYVAGRLKTGEQVKVFYPTEVTTAVLEGFVNSGRWGVTEEGFVKKPSTTSDDWDFVIEDGVNLPVFDSIRDKLTSFSTRANDTVSNAYFMIDIEGELYQVGRVERNNIYLKRANPELRKLQFRYFSNRGIADKSRIDEVKDAKVGDTIHLSGEGYFTVDKSEGKGFTVKYGGGDTKKDNVNTIRVDLKKLEKAVGGKMGELNLDREDHIVLDEYYYEIYDYNKDGGWVDLYGYQQVYGEESSSYPPYEWDDSRDPEQGDEVTYDGEQYTVVLAESGELVLNPSNHTRSIDVAEDIDSIANSETDDGISTFEAEFPDGLTPEQAAEEINQNNTYDWNTDIILDIISQDGGEDVIQAEDIRSEIYDRIYESESDSYDPSNFYSSDQFYWIEGQEEYYVIENSSEVVNVNTPDFYDKDIEYKSTTALDELVKIRTITFSDLSNNIITDISVTRDQIKADEKEAVVKKVDADGQYIWDYEEDLKGRDNVIGVLNYTKQNSVPAFRKIRPDAILVTDERGLQWWVSTVTSEDAVPTEVFQVKPPQLQPKKRKVTKTAQKKAEELTVKEYAESFFLARIPETELRVKSIQPAKTPEELKSKLDQLNKFAQSNAIFRRTGGKIQRGAAGQFSYGKGTPPQGEVRLRDRYIQDDAEYLAVLAHELGHALEFNMTGSTRTSTYKVFADSLTEEQTKTLTKELKEVTKSLVGAEEMARRPIYYNRRTELLARFLEKMVISPEELEDIAPTAVDLFEKSIIRSPLIREYMEAANEMIDKGAFKAWLPDLRATYQKHLGVRVGNIAFDREMVHRAMQERAKFVIEKFVKNKFKNVKDAPETLFRAAEAIKITRNGNPVFGTRDYTKPKNPEEEGQLILAGWKKVDEQIEGGIKVPVYARTRYTPQEGQNIFNSLSDEGKQLIRDFTAARDEARDYFNREMIKEVHKVEGDIEGWVYHLIEGEPSGTVSKRLRFKERKAGTRYKRTGKEGYVEDLQKAMTKVLIDLEGEKAFNKFIKDQFSTVTKPLREGEKPDAGWTEVRGSLLKGVGTPLQKRVVMSKDGKEFVVKQPMYQIPKEIQDRYELFIGIADEASTATRVVNSLNRYWRVNILTHGGTAMTNFFSGGVQYSAKVLTDFYTELLTGQVAMPQTRRNLSAMIKTLHPKGWTEESPDWVYGGDLSNYYGQFMAKEGRGRFDRNIDSYANKGLKLFSTAERYWKKVISIAENSENLETLGKVTKTGLKELTKEEEKLIAMINKEVDLYAYDYDNVPMWLEHHQRSTLGQAIKPFAKYPFKYFQQLTEVGIRPIFDRTLSWQERAAKLLAVSTIMAAYAGYSDDRKKQQETPEGTEETPARIRTQGRVFVGKDEEGNELFLRVSKYPFINITEAGIQLINGNTETSKDVVSDMLGSIAPVGDMALLLFNYRNTYDIYTPVPVVLAENASTFVPLSRLLGDVARMLDPFRRKEKTAFQAGIGRLIPTTDEALQKLLHGEVRTERVPLEGTVTKRFGEGKTRTTTDRELKQYWQDVLLSMLTGLYVTRINPEYAKAYEIRAEEKAKDKETDLSAWEQYLKDREENSGK